MSHKNFSVPFAMLAVGKSAAHYDEKTQKETKKELVVILLAWVLQ